ncbi:hypothetical protein CHARACLAT_009938 [Characodon lateralis]|uniref:SAM domain-containing protein n=1 Tax=Characodon lateralis TaxID=208331 RepID=A0ABU7DI83_9TELE|nr:hypothetical protein [Characodon lateralis]
MGLSQSFTNGACGKALDQPVGEWLEHVGLPQYESKFLLNGFDDLRFMKPCIITPWRDKDGVWHSHYLTWQLRRR